MQQGSCPLRARLHHGRYLPRFGQAKHARIKPTMTPPGIDPRNTREVSGAHSEFRVGIRDAPHVGRLRGRPSSCADQCCRATTGPGCSQFSEMFAAVPVAEPLPARLPPTLPWRVAVGSAAAGFAGCSDPRMKPTASSNRCHPCRVGGLWTIETKRHSH